MNPLVHSDRSSILHISEVEIFPVKPQGGLIAFASCVINGQLFLGNIGVHTRPNGGLRLVFPLKMIPNGKQISCCHPITREAGQVILDAIATKMKILAGSAGQDENVSNILRTTGENYGLNRPQSKLPS